MDILKKKYISIINRLKCVVCGRRGNTLTRHHCIPLCFQRYFPLDYMPDSNHDVLSLCESCHIRYEKSATKYKEELIPRLFQLEQIQYFENYKKNESVDSIYEEFIESIEDLGEFMRGWRKHFVETMNPKHLPYNWTVDCDGKIFFRNNSLSKK